MTAPAEEEKSTPRDEVVYSVVVPVCNSVDSLIELCQRLTSVFEATRNNLESGKQLRLATYRQGCTENTT